LIGEPRSIYFSTHLIHPPIKLEESKDSIKEVYHELSKVGSCDYDNISFEGFPVSPPRFTKQQGRTVSSCFFLSDRILIQEDWTDITLESFSKKIREILDRGFRLLELGFVIIQTCTVRSLFTPHHSADARVFLAEKACGLEGKIAPYFQRPAQMFGMRLLFPPLKDVPRSFDVRIESFNQDPRQVFVETIGTFHLIQPITPTNVDVALVNMSTTYGFCINDVKNFLNQFDLPEGGVQ
jgi:hypothetical protein